MTRPPSSTAASVLSALFLAACAPTPATSQPTGGGGATSTMSQGGGGAGGASTGGTTTGGASTGGQGGSAAVLAFTVSGAVSAGLNDDQLGPGVAIDGDGNTYWAVEYDGSIVFEDGESFTAEGGGQGPNTDVLVAALGPDQKVFWIRPATGGTITARSIALGPNGTLALAGQVFGTLQIAGDTPSSQNGAGGSDAYAFTLTSGPAGGDLVWARRFGVDAGRRAATSAAFEPDGSLVLAGRFQGQIDLGQVLSCSGPAPDYDAFVSRIDASGVPETMAWPVAQGGALTRETWSRIAVDPASQEVTLLRDCADTAGPNPCTGAFLARFGKGGLEKWHLPLPLTFSTAIDSAQPSGLDLALDLAPAPNGGVALAGGYVGAPGDLGCGDLPTPADAASSIVVARLDQNGACQWSHGYSGSGNKAARAVTVAPDGTVFVTGFFNGTLDLGEGLPVLTANAGKTVFVAAFDPAGHPLGVRSFAGTGNATAMAIASGAGQLALSGWLDGTLDADGTMLTTGGGKDAFLIRLAPTQVP